MNQILPFLYENRFVLAFFAFFIFLHIAAKRKFPTTKPEPPEHLPNATFRERKPDPPYIKRKQTMEQLLKIADSFKKADEYREKHGL